MVPFQPFFWPFDQLLQKNKVIKLNKLALTLVCFWIGAGKHKRISKVWANRYDHCFCFTCRHHVNICIHTHMFSCNEPFTLNKHWPCWPREADAPPLEEGKMTAIYIYIYILTLCPLKQQPFNHPSSGGQVQQEKVRDSNAWVAWRSSPSAESFGDAARDDAR